MGIIKIKVFFSPWRKKEFFTNLRVTPVSNVAQIAFAPFPTCTRLMSNVLFFIANFRYTFTGKIFFYEYLSVVSPDTAN